MTNLIGRLTENSPVHEEIRTEKQASDINAAPLPSDAVLSVKKSTKLTSASAMGAKNPK